VAAQRHRLRGRLTSGSAVGAPSAGDLRGGAPEPDRPHRGDDHPAQRVEDEVGDRVLQPRLYQRGRHRERAGESPDAELEQLPCDPGRDDEQQEVDERERRREPETLPAAIESPRQRVADT